MALDEGTFRLDKAHFSVVDMGEDSDDLAFWLAKTPQERMAALEHLRQVNFGYHPTELRLQRVFEVVEQPWG